MIKPSKKNRLNLIWAFAIGTALFFNTACQNNSDAELNQNEAQLVISGLDINQEIITKTGSDQEPQTSSLTQDDLSLRIENTRAEVLKTWAKYSEVPSTVNVTPGSYKVVAWSDVLESLPFFDGEATPYYIGEEKFAIAGGEQHQVNLVVKNGATKIKIEFDNQTFDRFYTNYSVDVRTTSQEIDNERYINYTPQTTLVGNFLPGTLRLRFHMTSLEDNQEYIFQPSPISGFEAAEIRTLKLKINSETGTNNLLITTEDGVEYEEEIRLELPSTIYPKNPPTINANNFNLGDVVESTEAYIPEIKYAATSKTPGGVKSYILRAINDNAKEALTQDAVDIVNGTEQERELLKSLGFVWDERLNTPQSAAELYDRAQLSIYKAFGGLKCKVNEDFTDYEFRLEITDIFGQTNLSTPVGSEPSQIDPFNFTVRVNTPIFGWVTPTNGNYWSKHAEFDIHYKTNNGVTPKLWVKNSDGSWSLCEGQNFVQNRGEVTGNGVQSVEGLTANTSYTFKLMLGEHSTEETTQTTEILLQLENGNMETWQWKQYSLAWFKKVPYYQPYAVDGSQFWATNNDRTIAYHNGGTGYRFNSFPAISHTRTSHSGTYAAELRSTSASNIDVLNGPDVTYDHAQVPGHMFVGTFSYSDKKDHLTPCKPFASRPKFVSFYSTYTAYNTEDVKDSYVVDVTLYSGDEEIGKGQYISPEGASVSDYTKYSVEVEYSNRRKRADKIYVSFKSSTQTHPEVQYRGYSLDYGPDDVYRFNESPNNAFIGSILRVDDIATEY